MVDAGGVAAGKDTQRVGPSSGVGLDVARGQRMPRLYFPLPAKAAVTTVLAGRTKAREVGAVPIPLSKWHRVNER